MSKPTLRLFTTSNLSEHERLWYDTMLKHAATAREHTRKEIEYRDKLLVALHRRLAYAVDRIASLLCESRSFVKTELARLRRQGKLKYNFKGKES